MKDSGSGSVIGFTFLSTADTWMSSMDWKLSYIDNALTAAASQCVIKQHLLLTTPLLKSLEPKMV